MRAALGSDTLSAVKCDKCESEATVHEVTIKGGKRHEQHLCESCAAVEGVAPQAVHTPITDLLSKYITAQSEAVATVAGGSPVSAPVSSGTCACCGLTYAQFRQSGLMGCPDCYTAFEAQLTPLLSRAHEGGTHHVGKSPRRPLNRSAPATAPAVSAIDPAQHAERVAQLSKKLAEAVGAEQYEKAAKIRDELARLEGKGSEPEGPSSRGKRGEA